MSPGEAPGAPLTFEKRLIDDAPLPAAVVCQVIAITFISGSDTLSHRTATTCVYARQIAPVLVITKNTNRIANCLFVC